MLTITQFQSIELFCTKRLIAEKIKSSDLDKFTAMHTNPEVMATLGGLRTDEQICDNLNWNLNQWQENGFGLWLFYLKDEIASKSMGYTQRTWVGRGGLRRVIVAGNEEIELGYALMPQFWNQGIATEIAKACVEIAFEVLRLDNIVSFTLITNKPSQRVMEKAGFEYERNIVYPEPDQGPDSAGLPHFLYRMKNPRKIEIVPYDTRWPEFYAQESNRIQHILGTQLKEIYHIGSTAIPDMSAKPVIDIMLVCDNLDKITFITEKLNELNYYNIRRHVIPHRSFFTRRQDEHISFNLHIRERGDPQIIRHINFRDYVIQHPDVANRYEKLKINLAAKFINDMNAYVFGKDELVQEIDAKAKLWNGKKGNFIPANTGPLSREWQHEKLLKAMEANLNVSMTHFPQYLDPVELIRIPGFTIVNSGLDDDTFNYVLEADFSSAEANRKITEVTNYFLQKRIPFSWWVSPYDKPVDLANYLENNGYENIENNRAMYFALDEWDGHFSVPPIKIVRAMDEKTLHDFAMVLTKNETAYKKYFSRIASVLTDDDPIEYYVGYVNDKPVVRGSTCYFAQVAGLYWLATAPAEKKKGYGTAMQYYQLKRAKDLGFHIAGLQTSTESYPLYRKLGYKECGIFRKFKLK